MTEEKRILYLKQLNHSQISERKKAIQNLGMVDDPHIFKILSSHFSDSHPEIRDALSRVFSRQKNRRTAEIVADTLHSPQLSVRSLAMEILKNLKSESVLPLRRLCKSPKPEIRRLAVELLGDIEDESAAPVLLEMLSDDDSAVRSAVIEALGKHLEIRAVPQLLALYHKNGAHKATILNALTRIFLYWEKNIIHPEQLETDPVLAFSLINTVQENGNASALNLMLYWLEENTNDMTDEVLKAVASILQKNEHIDLPVRFFPLIQNIRHRFREELNPEVVYTCLSRMASTGAFEFLLEQCLNDSKDQAAFHAMLQFTERFPAVFLLSCGAVPAGIRHTLLKALDNKNARIYDSRLVDLYSASVDPGEKKLLLNLAVKAGVPGADKICLSQLEVCSRRELPGVLSNLRKFNNESFWKLFYDYSGDASERIRDEAVRGMLRYPEKTAAQLLKDLHGTENGKLESAFTLTLLLPPVQKEHVFSAFIPVAARNVIERFISYVLTRGSEQDLRLTGRYLGKIPEMAVELLENLTDETVDETKLQFLKKVTDNDESGINAAETSDMQNEENGKGSGWKDPGQEVESRESLKID